MDHQEQPNKISFNYDLFLDPEGDFLHCEKLTFNNPIKEFRGKLIRDGQESSKEGSSDSSCPS